MHQCREMNTAARWPRLLLLAAACGLVSTCATLGDLADLSGVTFHLERASGARLAGIDLSGVRRFEDLRAGQLLVVGDAVRRGRLPLRFALHVGADNASARTYDLRLERLEWTLLLEDRETVSGVLEREVVLDPGVTTEIPIPIELDLLEFFDRGAADLARLALRAAGAGGPPADVRLRARPTLRTPLGSVRFPEEITIARREV